MKYTVAELMLWPIILVINISMFVKYVYDKYCYGLDVKNFNEYCIYILTERR